MVVQVVGEVIGHQVFSRHPHIDRVPELKFSPEFLQVILRDVRLWERGCFEEDVIPHFPRHLLGSTGRYSVFPLAFLQLLFLFLEQFHHFIFCLICFVTLIIIRVYNIVM